MSEREIPVHKLIILYIAREVPGIRRSKLTDAALASLSMDYFDLVQGLEELEDARLIQVAQRKDERVLDARDRAVQRCDLTPRGLEVLEALEGQIPPPSRRFLQNYLDREGMERRLADTVTARVEATPQGLFRLTCRQEADGGPALSLSLDFPSEAMARRAASAWRERSHEVFASLVEALLNKDEKKP